MKTHDYTRFSEEYSKLGITGTFYLGYRDIKKLLRKFARGKKTLDFGCGSGRSTRFLKGLGYDVTGVDKSPEMLEKDRENDKDGEYIQVENNKLPFPDSVFDIVSVFIVLMEVSTQKEMEDIFGEINRVIKKEGIVVIITDAEEMYKHETSSFTYDFPENRNIKSGSTVKVGLKGGNIIFQDYYWTDRDYRDVFSKTGFKVLSLQNPLASRDENIQWITETEHPHFALYVLGKI